jgi:hypothetical protein
MISSLAVVHSDSYCFTEQIREVVQTKIFISQIHEYFWMYLDQISVATLLTSSTKEVISDMATYISVEGFETESL